MRPGGRGTQDPHPAAGGGRVLGDGSGDEAAGQSDDGGTGGVHLQTLLAADRHTALIGSANLTDRALDDSIELGVVLRDPSAVGPVVDHFRRLIAPESGLMRRVRTGHPGRGG